MSHDLMAAPPAQRSRFRCNAACIELMTAAALVLSLVVALTIVSIGMARAETLNILQSSTGRFTLMGLVAFVTVAGVITQIVMRRTAPPQPEAHEAYRR
jgi:hypothetical protein